ncbi:MAG: M15 family metallopeptidase [Coriobacteriia bacterium]|nr:M15 family metallopeptidase [Coriobacteriia bacterium]
MSTQEQRGYKPKRTSGYASTQTRETPKTPSKAPERPSKAPQRPSIIPIGAFALLLTIVALLIWLGLSPGGEEQVVPIQDTVPPQNALAASDIADAVEEEDSRDESTDEEPKTPLVDEAQYPYYYEEQLAGRYEAFAAAHPEIPLDDVYWMVGCDLDSPPYENVQPVSDPHSILALVNKHYYLPQDFQPQSIVRVSNCSMRQEAATMMQEMIGAAASEGINIWVDEAHRGFPRQEYLYQSYISRDGQAMADTYSARPGFSEHHLGLAADMVLLNDNFNNTPEAIWIANNCWKFGYIVRYTGENTHITQYKPESWHVRYIGVEASQTMRENGILSFEEYWVKYIKYSPRG